MTSPMAPEVVLGENELVGVAALMSSQRISVVGPIRADLIAGGRSNLTFRLSDGVSQWVLRMPPRSGRTPSAHDVAREYRVTAALRGVPVPVPQALLLHEGEDLIGGPFAIAAYVEGRTVQTQEQLESLTAKDLEIVGSSLVETLAALHRVDYAAIGLKRFGRPDGYVTRQLQRWSHQWALVGDPLLATRAATLVSSLGAGVPPQRSTSIVHGDFRIDNAILDLAASGAPRLAAVVDWELSTIGDSVADVAMMCAYRHPAFDLIVGAPAAWTSQLLPEVDELAGRYEAAGGAKLDAWEFHLALAYFKIAVIAAGIDYRMRSGSGAGPGFDTAGASVPIYLELGLRAIGRA